MIQNENLLNKNVLAVMKLAGALGRYRSGDRLPKLRDLAEEIKLSVGTTQYGLNYLRDQGAISVIMRGHLGTFIESLDYDRLLGFTGSAARACVMPLPYSLRYEGLATAFSKLGNKNGKFYLAFMNGSIKRIRVLQEGRYNCALVSRMAAEEAITQGMMIDIAVSYGPSSFLETHVLVHREKLVGKVRNIGLDRDSMDQVLLSEAFLKEHPGIRVFNLPYTHIINRLLAREVDSTIWNLDYIKEHHPSLHFSPLKLPVSRLSVQMSMTEAVLVVRKNDAAMTDYLSRVFPKQKVLKIQEAVYSRRRIPEY